MARVFATIQCAIWEDEDFLALTGGAQRTYLFLFTQATIGACGLLPLTLRRWRKKCRDADLEVWLAELTDTNFILIDEDTEELLVRSFVKHDGGHKHALRAKAVVSTARTIESPLLRETCAAELAKVGLSIAAPERPESNQNATLEPQQSERLRSVNSTTDLNLNPHPESGKGEPVASDTPRPDEYCVEHMPNGTKKACNRCANQAKRVQRWDREEPLRRKMREAAAEVARAECPLCDPDGWLLDSAGEPTARKCTEHRRAG